MAFGLFKKKTKNKSEDRYKTVKIKEVVEVTKDAVNLVFDISPEELAYEAGQFITIIDTVNGNKIRRAYSLCSSPFADENPAVTVKRVEGGQMSNHINDHYQVGQDVQIMEPMGLFTTQYDELKERNLCFIGGGSGITPLLSLIKSILIKEPKCTLALIYCNRNESSIIFLDELKRLIKEHSNFTVHHILEENSNGIAEVEGRPSPDIISDMINTHNLTSCEFFICGPQPMMDVAVEGLKLSSVSSDSIRMESFEAGVTSPKELVSEGKNEASNVTILLDGEEHMIPVPMNASILETAMDAGLDMPYSCQSGLCTACRGKCLEGDVTTDDAEGLSQEELDEGYRLLCIGKPASNKIKIEVG